MRQVNLRKLLPDGRVRIHYFVHAEAGPVQNPSGVVMSSHGPMAIEGGKGYIACQPKRASVLPEVKGDRMDLFPNSDEARAVTCPQCQATEEYKAVMAKIKEIESPAHAG